MKLYRLIASEAGQTKLFVGGLHGKEGLYTAPILEQLAKDEVYAGRAIIVPCLVEHGKYVDVLSEEYYRSRAGIELLQLIENYKPYFYFELHAYSEHSYSRLTDPERELRIGVPPFVDLGTGILLGSIAPILRRKFSERDFCITIEVPNWKPENENVRTEILRVLRLALSKVKREEVIAELRMWYPAQMQKAEVLFRQYYRNKLRPF
ncbi:MAG: DUF2119 family protein [Halobacteriota archaeon]